jgi:hypothetical protein
MEGDANLAWHGQGQIGLFQGRRAKQLADRPPKRLIRNRVALSSACIQVSGGCRRNALSGCALPDARRRRIVKTQQCDQGKQSGEEVAAASDLKARLLSQLFDLGSL